MNTDQKQEAGGGKKRIGLSHRFAQMNTDQKQEAGRPETEEIRMSHCFSLRWGLRRQRTSDISHRFALMLTDQRQKTRGVGRNE